jgi:hypothetical protein
MRRRELPLHDMPQRTKLTFDVRSPNKRETAPISAATGAAAGYADLAA